MRDGRRPYSARVLELFQELPGAGALPAGDGEPIEGAAMALDRGAWVVFEARLEGSRLVDCRFRAWGCPHVLAAAALVSRSLCGREIADASPLSPARLREALEAPAEKTGRLIVVEDAALALLARARALQ